MLRHNARARAGIFASRDALITREAANLIYRWKCLSRPSDLLVSSREIAGDIIFFGLAITFMKANILLRRRLPESRLSPMIYGVFRVLALRLF